MGVIVWLVCGLAAFFVARIVPLLRPTQRGMELVSGVVTAAIGGIAATALDFGGWNALDWRAALFSFFCGLAAIGIVRLARSMR